MKGLMKAVDTNMSRYERKLTKGEVRFTDSYWNDYKFYVLNNHLILSIFCGHPENPYSGCPRLLAVISSNFYAIFLAICLTYEPSESKRMIFEYTLVVVLQSLYDLEVQYISSCACLHRQGVPTFVRMIIAPCLGIFAAVGCCGCTFILLGVMLLVFWLDDDTDDDEVNKMFTNYIEMYGISLVTSIFPLGLIIYHFKRCFEKDDSEAHVDNAANSPGVV